VNRIRTIIADPEPPSRARIRALLDGESDFEVAAECDCDTRAVAAIDSLRPELIILDVQPPAIDGFHILRQLDGAIRPAAIFVTASERHAVQAFDVQALDYLVKPVTRERFAQALDRARSLLMGNGSAEAQRRLAELLADYPVRRPPANRFLVRAGDRYLFVSTGEIDWVEAEGNYMRLHVGGRSFLLRETMQGMERRLFPRQFLRIHRSRIVNLDRVRELIPSVSGDYHIVLQDGLQLRMSRKFRPALERLLGQPC
jgi:two-component system LytT family response regulator